MIRLRQWIRKLWDRESGATATEYAAMLSLLVLALLVILGPLQEGWVRVYTAIGGAVVG